MRPPVIERLRVALIVAPLAEPIVAPFGTVRTRLNILVRVETSDGGFGLGEAWGNFPPWGCRDRVDILLNVVRPLLVGQALDDPARLYDLVAGKMRPLANQLGAPGPFQQALCGADIALRDNCARRAGVPLADQIRGGAAPREADVYATNLLPKNPAAIEDMALKGHNRFKFRVPPDSAITLRCLREARAIACERPLMADATQSHSLATLRPMAKALAEFDLGWLEEPFPVDDIAAYKAWRNEPVRPPLALGENSYRRSGFRHLLDEVDPDVVQPDITKTGGISEGRDICRQVLAAGKRACLHMYGGPVGLFASAQLSAAIEGMSWMEMDSLPNPLFDMLLDDEPVIRNGKLQLPKGAGLGDHVIREKVFDAAEVK